MNWLQKTALPIQITPELDAFADKALDVLFSDKITEYGNSDEAFYEDHLEFGRRHIPIAVVLRHPAESGSLASAETPTWWEQRSSYPNGWSLSACYVNIYETIPPSHHRRDLKRAMLHELVHCVDPKLNDPNLFETGWHQQHRRNISAPDYVDSPAHYTSPWEQDAFMSSEAYDQVSMWKRNGVSIERALIELRNHLADNPREQEWEKSPDLWKRYMQTMARAVRDIYQI
ncbi:MAG: hypothetical protein ACXAC5_03415 [Promethearchaeota archaeon]|jgi:hypothetical protein